MSETEDDDFDPDFLQNLPDVDDGERREVRRKYREISENLNANKHDFIQQNDRLKVKLEEVNTLFKDVKMTREAALDASVVARISQLARQKAQSLHTDFVVFNPVEFVEKLVTFLTGQQSTQEQRQVSKNGWEKLGAAVRPFFRQTPSIHLMLGSFERGEIIRGPGRVRRPVDKEVGPKTIVDELKTGKNTEKKEGTTVEVENILGILKYYYNQWNKQPICLFEFVINPTSFGQTVENLFYVSFLIRDGHARMFMDSDRLPVIEPVIKEAETQTDPAEKRCQQVMMNISVEEWKTIIDVFNIGEPLIPTREPVEPSNGFPPPTVNGESSSSNSKGKTKKK